MEKDSLHQKYDNWGPAFEISFDLMILEAANDQRGIFAFMGDDFDSAPLILVTDLVLQFRTSNPLAAEKFSYDYPVHAKKWIKIEISQNKQNDDTVRITEIIFLIWKVNDDFPVRLLHQSQRC